MTESHKSKQEIINQGLALSQLDMDVMDAINLLACDFRCILNDFWIEFHVVASPDDLIFISSQHFNCNIREIK